MVRNVFAVDRTETSDRLPARGASQRVRLRALRPPHGEQGSAMIEFALVFPVLLIMVTGVLSFGIYLRQNLALTDAVNIGAKLLSVNRGNTLDPCALVYNAVVAAAPSLNPSNMTFTYTFDGTAQSGSSCSSASSSSGPPSELVAGTPISVTVTYPCSLTVVGVSYIGQGGYSIAQNNLVPGCLIAASLTEIEQ